MNIDDAHPASHIAFETCVPVGCVVRVNFSRDEMRYITQAKQIKVNAKSADGGKNVGFNISMKGFSQAVNRAQVLSQ